MKLHHIAYVCDDVEAKARSLAEVCGCAPIGKIIEDTLRQVRILFLETQTDVGIELLEPMGPNSPILGWLRNGGGLYHLCFEVDDLDVHLEKLFREGKARLAQDPAPAPALSGRRVAFVVTAECDLIEFVESEQASRKHGDHE